MQVEQQDDFIYSLYTLHLLCNFWTNLIFSMLRLQFTSCGPCTELKGKFVFHLSAWSSTSEVCWWLAAETVSTVLFRLADFMVILEITWLQKVSSSVAYLSIYRTGDA